jgi:hypothetical protein
MCVNSYQVCVCVCGLVPQFVPTCVCVCVCVCVCRSHVPQFVPSLCVCVSVCVGHQCLNSYPSVCVCARAQVRVRTQQLAYVLLLFIITKHIGSWTKPADAPTCFRPFIIYNNFFLLFCFWMLAGACADIQRPFVLLVRGGLPREMQSPRWACV